MTLTDISILRLYNQQIASSGFKSPKELVDWMGAMQAQEYNMAKWAIGVRTGNSSDSLVEDAVNKGEIIRTHVLRPTWHFVSATDIYWMLELTIPHIITTLKTRQKQLELTQTLLKQSNSVIEKALEGGKQLTRDELKEELEKAKITNLNERVYHILFWAELSKIICGSASKGKERTYALLAEWVPKTDTLSRDEALARLVKKYFTSHGPATILDFAWWSGLSVTNARRALEMVKKDFISEEVDSQIYWFSDTASVPKSLEGAVYLLPAFDEFIISYKDRRASLPHENNKTAISSNGIFYPVIVYNGQVAGLWSRTIKKDMIIIAPHFFSSRKKEIPKDLIEKAALKYGSFLNKKVEVKFG